MIIMTQPLPSIMRPASIFFANLGDHAQPVRTLLTENFEIIGL